LALVALSVIEQRYRAGLVVQDGAKGSDVGVHAVDYFVLPRERTVLLGALV
jgi:hypothetical protein